MAVPTLDQLFTQLTREEVEASALSVAAAVELPVTAWEPLSVGREIIVILCELMATFSSGAGSTAAAAGLLDYARGLWLELTGNQVYETDRIAATAGTCICVLTNTSLVPYSFSLNDVRPLNSDSHATYTNTNTSPVNLTAWSGSGAYPTCELPVQAEQPGSAANAAVGAIDALVSPLAGILITNSTPLVGTDQETEGAYKLRCREASARLSPNGPADAYNYFAKSTLRGDGTNCGVTRTKPYQPVTQPGIVIVYLASAAGTVGPTDVALVQTNLLANCVPTGITATAVSCTPVSFPLQATVYLGAGSTADPDSIAAAVVAALTEYFEALPIGGVELLPGAGGYVFLDMLIATIAAAAPEQIVQVVLTNISTDTALDPFQVAVLVSSASDINVVLT